ncbi:hypothetical protein [Nocardioides sp. GXZ039]|uniref:hypothetical protein n=1 Tax=Nocardioides sp. GXZ039 TaxID=3136018 RepID=UPI0030F398C7
MADKTANGRDFETTLAATGIDLLRRARRGETERPAARFFKPLRQIIEWAMHCSVYRTTAVAGSVTV